MVIREQAKEAVHILVAQEAESEVGTSPELSEPPKLVLPDGGAY